MTRIRVVDFETTGLPPDAAVVEAGWCDVTLGDEGEPMVGMLNHTLVHPGRPIPPEASAVHHLIDADVAKAPPAETVFAIVGAPRVTHFAAHRADFEQSFFTGGGRPWVCTYKAARRLWPDAPKHSNTALWYWRGMPGDRHRAQPAHRAGPDAYMTAHLLADQLRSGTSLHQLVKWTTEPVLLRTLEFGKHQGMLYSEAPLDYLQWCSRQRDMDDDVKFTVQCELDRRGGRGGDLWSR